MGKSRNDFDACHSEWIGTYVVVNPTKPLFLPPLGRRPTAGCLPNLKKDTATMLSDDLAIVLFTSVCIAVCLASFQILDRRSTFRGQ